MDTRSLRLRLGLTQKQVARACEVNISTVRAWERGAREPGEAALRVLKVLDRSSASQCPGGADDTEDAAELVEDLIDAAAERRFLKRLRSGGCVGLSLEDFVRECEKLRAARS